MVARDVINERQTDVKATPLALVLRVRRRTARVTRG